MPPDAHADQSMAAYYVFDDWVQRDNPDDAGWGEPPELPLPPLRLDCLDYFCCFLFACVVCITAVLPFLGFLLDNEYSVLNVLALLLTRMHILAVKSTSSSPAPSSWTALELLSTCPAPIISMPPVCYEWEKPASARTLPGSGSADSNWSSSEHDRDYNKADKKCFDSLVRDATWTCSQQEDDYMAAMKCFESQSDDPPQT